MGISLFNFNLVLPHSVISKKTQFPTLLPPQVGFCRSSKRRIKSRRIAIMAENPTSQQKITVGNGHGEKLVGVLHETGSHEVVILCHGFRSDKDENILVGLAAALEKEGISAYRFDFAGNGESEGSFQYGNYSKETDDLHAVVKHFSQNNRTVTAVLGHSKGGNVVLLYASRYHDVSTVVNVCGRYRLERGIEQFLGVDFMARIDKEGYMDVKNRAGEILYRVTKESLMERLNTDMHQACLSINPQCRVLTVHGSADEIIPVEDALDFAKIIPNHSLHLVEGADHEYSSHEAEVASIVVPFIKEGLQKSKSDN